MTVTRTALHESSEQLCTAISLDPSKSVYTRISITSLCLIKHVSVFIQLGEVGTAADIAEISESKRIRQENIICLYGRGRPGY